MSDTDTTTLPAIPGLVNTDGLTLLLPDGVTADQLHWGFRFCLSDHRSTHGFRWPFPGNWAEAPGPVIKPSGSPCPSQPGDGICVARTISGARIGGMSPNGAILIVGWLEEDVLCDTPDKVRVRKAWVADTVTLLRFVGANANLRGANLQGADLQGADLRGADLRGAYLRGADLQGAYLRDTDLQGANLRGANLQGANLQDTDLQGANLRDANLRDANLQGADLQGANLRGAYLRGAYCSPSVTLPSGYRRTSSGLIVMV